MITQVSIHLMCALQAAINCWAHLVRSIYSSAQAATASKVQDVIGPMLAKMVGDGVAVAVAAGYTPSHGLARLRVPLPTEHALQASSVHPWHKNQQDGSWSLQLVCRTLYAP